MELNKIKFMRKILENNINKNIIYLIVIATVISIELYSNILNAKFWIIDDHHILSTFDGKINISILDLINKYFYDINHKLFESGRFRPAYQILFPLEIFFLEYKVKLYMIFSICVYIIFIAETSILFYLKTKKIILSVIILIILSLQLYWSDILNRIFTAEIWAIFLLIFYMPILFHLGNKIQYNKKIEITQSFLYGIFTIMVATTKESMLFIGIIPFIILIVVDAKRNKIFYGINIISILVISFIFLKIIHDVYLLENIDYVKQSRITYINSFFKIYIISFLGFFNWAILIFLIAKRGICVAVKNHLYENLFVLIMVIFQIVMYSGLIPNGTRYDFPALFFLIFNIYFMHNILNTINNNLLYNFLICSYLLLILFTNNVFQNINKVIKNTGEHVERTILYEKNINKLVKIIDDSNPLAIIINSQNVWDYEYISSIYKFIHFYRHDANVYLYFDSHDKLSDTERIFAQRLELISKGNLPKEGVLNNKEWGYKNIDKIEINRDNCVNIFFDGSSHQKFNCMNQINLNLR